MYLYIHILINRQANFLSVSNMSVSATFQKLEVCVQINVLVKCFKFFCILCTKKIHKKNFFSCNFTFFQKYRGTKYKAYIKFCRFCWNIQLRTYLSFLKSAVQYCSLKVKLFTLIRTSAFSKGWLLNVNIITSNFSNSYRGLY